ncbi:hypothetical protein ACFW61_24605 [Streptomyces microflavus]|uniref:hypothetical protein n=1 Tax=Streptomyces microflavus TaxID=1919 RepID=UPI0036B53D0F
MTDTSPTSADQLRAVVAQALAGVWYQRAAEETPAAPEEHCAALADAVLSVLPAPALAVARQLLGTNVAEGATTVLEPQDHPGADLFVALQHAGLDVDEANRRMYAYARMVLRQEKAITAPPAPADRATTLRERADYYEDVLRNVADPSSDPRYWSAVHDVALGLRRLAADAAAGVQPPTEGEPEAQQAAVVQAIRDFQFHNYGLDTVDPNSEYAEWVGDLASVIVGALPAAPAVPEERP